MKDRKRARGRAAPQRDDGGADRMGQACEPGRQQRMIAAQETRLDDAGKYLRRTDQRAGRHRLQRRRARGFENSWQVRGHRAGDAPGRRKGEGQQDHGAVDCDVRFYRCRNRGPRPCHRGQHEKIQGQADQDMCCRPTKAGVAPPDAFQSERRQRPADGRGKARDQGDAGDRAPRRVAIDASQRAEGGVVQAKSHADAEQQPGRHQHRDRIAGAEQRQSRGKRQIGDRQHRPAADEIDLPADARAEHRGNHQRGREGGKDPVRGDAEVARDRIGEDRGQVIARSPGQRLRGAERQNDR